MTRILAVDDEPAIRRLLSGILERGGCEVVLAATAGEGLAAIKKGDVDAVLLDLGLPDRDGLEAISAIRAKHKLPIIVVTARGEISEKIAALDLGADDYVTKPFDSDELLARLRSALRRAGASDPGAALVFGPLELDAARHVLRRDGEPVALTPKEFALLEALMKAGGRILTHTALLERVWGKAHIGDIDYLRVAIRSLRVKLEVDPSQPTLVRNEPGIGYRLVDGG